MGGAINDTTACGSVAVRRLRSTPPVGGQGNFYEGVMTMGAASEATTNAVQANIVAAGYGM